MAAASGTTYVARGIYGHPGATALTIAPDGRIQAIGSTPPDDTTIDRRWAEAWLYPGFIEAHSHPDTGWLWGAGAYLGAIERRTPGGGTDAGCHSIEQVLSRLQAARDSTDETTPILAWGYDPWHVEGSPLDRRTLDQVSATRPVFVLHASQHVVSVNSAVIAMDALDTNPTPGIQRDPAGKPTGILAEPEAILATAIARAALAGEFQPSALQQFGVEASHAGYTTATDLDTTALLRPDSADAYASTVNAPEFPVRLAAFCHIDTSSEQQLAASIQAARNARQLGTAKLRTGFAKLFLDGSIQAETAKLTHPYLDAGTGQWLTEPARFASILAELDTAGLTVHTHGNGDAAARAFADALNALPLPAGHQYQRHALTHAQLADDATLTRIRDAGGTVSFLINHIRWWGGCGGRPHPRSRARRPARPRGQRRATGPGLQPALRQPGHPHRPPRADRQRDRPAHRERTRARPRPAHHREPGHQRDHPQRRLAARYGERGGRVGPRDARRRHRRRPQPDRVPRRRRGARRPHPGDHARRNAHKHPLRRTADAHGQREKPPATAPAPAPE